MFSRVRIHFRRHFYFLSGFFLVSEVLMAQAPTATQPTVSETNSAIEGVWRKASAKYDKPRSEILIEVDRVAESGPFSADWQSLQKYRAPDWYKDAKFGIFIHWGVYSVPAFGSEWYPREMYREGSKEYQHHLEKYGPQSQFGYKDFIPQFTAGKFDPKEWGKLFEESGAKYVVPVFEHHDGFAMYDSGLSDWTIRKMGPKRDAYGELAAELRSRGLRLGASSHRIEHNFFLDGGRKIASDVNDPQFAAFYGPAHQWMESKKTLLEDWTFVSDEYLNDWLARDAEIVQKYKPDIFYFDWWIGQPSARRHLSKFAAFYYNYFAKNGKTPVINYKLSAMEEHSAVLDIERGQLSAIRPLYWQTDTSISNKSWGFIENDSFKSAQTIVDQLIDIVSKNGNLLVNVGPRSDGTFPDEVQRTLRDVGAWLKINGEAIYGTRAWTVFGEGPTAVVEGPFHDTDSIAYGAQDFRFTTKGNALYVIEMGWPENREAVVHSLDAARLPIEKITSVSMLGNAGSLTFEQKNDGLHLHLPEKPTGKYGYSFKLELKADPTAP
jgi:alpha-L-fucosidase